MDFVEASISGQDKQGSLGLAVHSEIPTHFGRGSSSQESREGTDVLWCGGELVSMPVPCESCGGDCVAALVLLLVVCNW